MDVTAQIEQLDRRIDALRDTTKVAMTSISEAVDANRVEALNFVTSASGRMLELEKVNTSTLELVSKTPDIFKPYNESISLLGAEAAVALAVLRALIANHPDPTSVRKRAEAELVGIQGRIAASSQIEFAREFAGRVEPIFDSLFISEAPKPPAEGV